MRPGMAAGRGDATATMAGTPASASSGVAIDEPPLPNMPPKNPTAAPMPMIRIHVTTPLNDRLTQRRRTNFRSDR